MTTPGQTAGFSLIELLVSTVVLLVFMAALFSVLGPRQWGSAVDAETADVQQRLRVAVDALSTDLMIAGSGGDRGARAGSLFYYFAPIAPYRRGLRNSDAPGSYKADTITLVYAVGNGVQTSLAQAMPAQSGDAAVATEPGCPMNDPLCGFKVGMSVVIFDDSGSFSGFTVMAVQGSQLSLQHNFVDEARVYPAGSTILEASFRTYYRKADAATDTFQLVRYDGARGADVPVVDHVVGLSFEYYGEPQPPLMVRALQDPVGPWTTYGPKPPPLEAAPTTFAAGENCAFALDALSRPTSRLTALAGAGQSLVLLDPAQLLDGPWCPDAASPNRYDADLLRIRKVVATVRVEASSAALRGPVGALFSRGGTSDGGGRMAPDQEIRIQITPRNLNLAR